MVVSSYFGWFFLTSLTCFFELEQIFHIYSFPLVVLSISQTLTVLSIICRGVSKQQVESCFWSKETTSAFKNKREFVTVVILKRQTSRMEEQRIEAVASRKFL